MGTKYIVNNLSGQTINNQQLQPYKVFTALLTQSGGKDYLNLSEGKLTIGVTYLIYDLEGVVGADFTNVGAPNNNVGTYFVATGTTPIWGTNPIGVGVLQYNPGAPVVTVLENTIGNIWFTYNSNGNYSMNSIGLLPSYSTWGVADCATDNNLTIQPVYINVDGQGPDVLYVVVAGGDDFGDNVLRNTPIEIRVYN